MYTGYFSKLKKYTDAGLIPVAISRMQPSFYKGASYTKLAPSWNILSAFKHPELAGEEAASQETPTIFVKGSLTSCDMVDINSFFDLLTSLASFKAF